jgi:hypothetical protein
MAGLPFKKAAFTGTGFTTSGAEKVVNHPVRRLYLPVTYCGATKGPTMRVAASLCHEGRCTQQLPE